MSITVDQIMALEKRVADLQAEVDRLKELVRNAYKSIEHLLDVLEWIEDDRVALVLPNAVREMIRAAIGKAKGEK